MTEEARTDKRERAMQSVVTRRPIVAAMQGQRAGFISRLAACIVDIAVVGLAGVGVLVAISVVRLMIKGFPFHVLQLPQYAIDIGYFILAVGYLSSAWAAHGRTAGDSMFGLRVVGADGHHLRPMRSLVRAVICVIAPWVLLWAIVSRRNAGIHDLIVKSAVVYDWSYKVGDAR